MSVNVAWDNDDKTTTRYDFDGRWTWDEFYAAVNDAFTLTRSVKHRVDSISNFLPGANLPPNALLHFRRAMDNAPANRGVTVIVGGSMFINTMVTVFSRLNRSLGERLLLARTVEQARDLLRARRS